MTDEKTVEQARNADMPAFLERNIGFASSGGAEHAAVSSTPALQ